MLVTFYWTGKRDEPLISVDWPVPPEIGQTIEIDGKDHDSEEWCLGAPTIFGVVVMVVHTHRKRPATQGEGPTINWKYRDAARVRVYLSDKYNI